MFTELLHMPMGRGGLDLTTAARPDFDVLDHINDPDAFVCAVTADRQVAVEQADPDVTETPETGTDGFERFTQAQLQNYAGRLSSDELEEAYCGGRLFYIGRHGSQPCFGLMLQEGGDHEIALTRIRAAGAALEAWQSTLVSHTLALMVWHSNTKHCSVCGNALKVQAAGWEVFCQSCQRIEYPRHDPAIIVAVTDEQDRLFFGNNVLWKNPKSVSIIAGYVEAGESPELAVARETMEETNLTLKDITYVGSQAWPFPRSLMLGYRARTDSTQLKVDHSELNYGMFFTREQFLKAVENGEINAPGPATIASVLVCDWLGGPIPYPDELPIW